MGRRQGLEGGEGGGNSCSKTKIHSEDTDTRVFHLVSGEAQ